VKVCIVGEAEKTDDEGMRKIASCLGRELARFHTVKTFSPMLAVRPAFWKQIKQYAPDVIQYIPGPSLKSFAVMKILSWLHPQAVTVMGAPLFQIPRSAYPFLRFIVPDLMLAQSHRRQEFFRRRKVASIYFPLSGVDADLFQPVSPVEKRALRLRYNFDESDFIVLHVGSIKLKRNVQALGDLLKAGCQPIVVGSTTTGIDANLAGSMIVQKIKLVVEYIERIHELYQLADCYVFPTPVENRAASIELPLSVVEAASCNLPIVATRFGALPDVFPDTSGFAFIDSSGQIADAVESVARGNKNIQTRERVRSLSWERIAANLSHLYEDFVAGVPIKEADAGIGRSVIVDQDQRR
jgi:glycosyltransferase involved in cell wall biosynthesis